MLYPRSPLPGLILVLFLAGCPSTQISPALVVLSGKTMGTSYSVKLSSLPDGLEREKLQVEIDRLLETINDQMSTWRADSEISRFNRHPADDWFSVSPDVVVVVNEAIRVSQLTDGAFDVTVGPLVNLWNFGPNPGEDRVPSDAEINAAREKIGYQYLETRKSPPALRKKTDGLYLDLSAIAKGFAVDRVAELLEGKGIPGYLVEIGGETRTYGTKRGGNGWILGIEAPRFGERRAYKAVELTNQAMATSGDYRNYFEKEGQRYSHTLDPRTGRPIEHRLASVSVVAESCMTADALATAVMVLGSDKGYNLVITRKRPALLIVREEGKFVEKLTPEFEQMVVTEPVGR